MRVALAQINAHVGDLRRNVRRIISFARDADRRGADLVVFPELCITGYPPHDLLEHPAFLDEIEHAIADVAAGVPTDLGILIGAPVRNPDARGKRLFNAALLLEGGRLVAQVCKSLLPTYEVYDEDRYFEPAKERRCVNWRGVRLGIHICEDMWNSDTASEDRLYDIDPLDDLAADGADLFINLSASPFSSGQRRRRTAVIERICERFRLPFVTVSQIGASAELIFDGDSRVHLGDGRVAVCAPTFEEDLVLWDTDDTRVAPIEKANDLEDVRRALVLGMSDYYAKAGTFSGVLLGLSGGIDSAVTAALAADAFGANRVLAVMAPTKYTSEASIEDARKVAGSLGIAYREVPIQPAVDALLGALDRINLSEQEGIADDAGGGEQEGTADGAVGGGEQDSDADGAGQGGEKLVRGEHLSVGGDHVSVVEENVQARARAVILMGLSNQSNRLALGTGNKSESAVGYTTLYGDATGGLGVLSDVYKTQVYELAEHINRRSAREVIPERVISKHPSAELRPGQHDQEALPPYHNLDAILIRYIEGRLDVDAIVAETGLDRDLVLDVVRRVDSAEFKRRQAPPGLRVSRRPFVTGYRMPLINGWRHGVMDTVPQS